MGYIDSLLEKINDDTYSAKNVLSPGFRAGLGVEKEASDELTGAGAFDGMPVWKQERIAQIKKRLAEIAEAKKKYDVEEEIGKYKFLYDNDPSTLMNYRQNLRNAKATEEIRKSNEKAASESNIQNAWKQNAIDLEVARYDLAAAKNAYDEAKGANNPDAMRRAQNDISRAQAKFNRISRENAMLRDRMMTSLGVNQGSEQEVETPAQGPAVDYEGEIRMANEMKTLDGELERLDKSIVTDNVNIDKKKKIANINGWLSDIERSRKAVNDSNLSEEQKQTRLTKLADMEKKVRDYGKPQGKGGQGTKMTKEDYQRELDGLKTKSQLVAKGYKWLTAAKNLGATHPMLDAAIGVAAGK